MKRIHFPTLLLHILLLLLAKLLLPHYPDGFLSAACLLLGVHLIYSCISPKSPALTHLIGSALQSAVFALGLIGNQSDSSSLGTGLALLIYMMALGVSILLEAVIAIVRHCLKQK